jgi:hypothetical protein
MHPLKSVPSGQILKDFCMFVRGRISKCIILSKYFKSESIARINSSSRG